MVWPEEQVAHDRAIKVARIERLKKAVEEMDIYVNRAQERYEKMSATYRKYKAELNEMVREIYPGVDADDMISSPDSPSVVPYGWNASRESISSDRVWIASVGDKIRVLQGVIYTALCRVVTVHSASQDLKLPRVRSSHADDATSHICESEDGRLVPSILEKVVESTQLCSTVHGHLEIQTEAIDETSEWDSHTPRPSFFDHRGDHMSLLSVLEKLLGEEALSSVERDFIQLETDRLFPANKRYELMSLEEEAVRQRGGFKRYIMDRYHQSAEDIIADGMVIPFVDSFRSSYKQTIVSLNRVPKHKHRLVDDRLRVYLEEGVISEISKDKVKFVAGISLVPRKDDPDNDREVLDFTELNRYIKVQECKLPSVDDLHILVQRFSVATTIDIKSCFTQIPLHPSAKEYCCLAR